VFVRRAGNVQPVRIVKNASRLAERVDIDKLAARDVTP